MGATLSTKNMSRERHNTEFPTDRYVPGYNEQYRCHLVRDTKTDQVLFCLSEGAAIELAEAKNHNPDKELVMVPASGGMCGEHYVCYRRSLRA